MAAGPMSAARPATAKSCRCCMHWPGGEAPRPQPGEEYPGYPLDGECAAGAGVVFRRPARADRVCDGGGAGARRGLIKQSHEGGSA